MGYKSLAECVADLEKHGHLVRIKEEVDPYLEMAAIHLRVYEKQGPALLFENVKGSPFKAVSNLFGTIERSKFMFRDSLPKVQELVELRSDPMKALKKPLKYVGTALTALTALPLKQSLFKQAFQKTTISAIPQIVNWPMDGGPFITMPQVFTEDIDKPGVMNSNLGMYRIQLAGNDYLQDKEIGLHYQIHRGIGVHQTKANKKGQPLKVSIFVGGPPSHPLAAVMPLPEGLSELTFAGALGNRRFRYFRDEEDFVISADADFVITGTVEPHQNKPEGPFGDHLGYYSLVHPFPLMKVHNVYHKKDALWSFTVVGRPPQEDTSFGELIHELTGNAIPQEVPGLKEVHAVDAAGVHPLLLAIGSERYTPYLTTKQPAEILTIANHILGTGQLSLAKFVFITADDTNQLSTHHVQAYFEYILSRLDLGNDIHFYTKTTMDTLDYSGEGLNAGSKVVIAAYGDVKRNLATTVPTRLLDLNMDASLVMPGVIAVNASTYTTVALQNALIGQGEALLMQEGVVMMIRTEDPKWMASDLNNFLWAAFTRTNPSHDIEAIDAFTVNKHWGAKGPLVFDATIKPHHAPPVLKDAAVEKRVDAILEKYGY